jgi:hypothetical protein
VAYGFGRNASAVGNKENGSHGACAVQQSR